jgi:hypothetical protein
MTIRKTKFLIELIEKSNPEFADSFITYNANTIAIDNSSESDTEQVKFADINIHNSLNFLTTIAKAGDTEVRDLEQEGPESIEMSPKMHSGKTQENIYSRAITGNNSVETN